MNEQLDFLLRSGAVKRYHTMRTVHSQDVAQHSFGVALLVMLLLDDPSSHVLKAALLHDAAEHETGDIPAPVKRLLDISEEVSKHEENLLASVGIDMPILTEDEAHALKFADTADLLLFSASEIALGNSRMNSVAANGMSYLEELRPFTDPMQRMYDYIMTKFEEITRSK